MLSVVIPTTNRPDSLTKLVESLQLQKIASGSYEILVVYNNELDKKNSPLRETYTLQILNAAKPGVNHARNYGAQCARGDIILFLDDDCEAIDPYFLQKHVDYHQQNPQLVAIGGPYLIAPTASVYDQIYQQNNINWIAANQQKPFRSTALLGGNASYKAAVFQRGMRFTEEILYGGSETPLNTLLALKYGPHGYFEDLAVLHNTCLSFASLMNKAFRQGAGAGLQTKLYGHQLQHVTPRTSHSSRVLRWGLQCYALFFSVGYQAQTSQRNIVFVFVQTLWRRLVMENLNQLYWWQHAQIGHPLRVFRAACYWSAYPLVMKTHGFLASLTEPLPFSTNTSFLQRFSQRSLHVTKKLGWLCLKVAGAR